MKFSTKLSLSFTALLAAGLCAVGLAMVGRSFADSLASAAETAGTRQYSEAYAITRTVLAGTPDADGQYQPWDLAAAAQNYAESPPGSSLALFLDGSASVYSNLPQQIPRATLLEVLAAGREQTTLARAGSGTWLLLALPLNIPGREAVLVSACDVSGVFASRDAQLAAWLAATLAVLAAGAAASAAVSRRLTAPLTRLQQASGQIAAGDYASRTAVDTDDEIGALSRSFDEMAAAVESRIAALDENVRRQKDFVAAFTHEIKTPMTGMLGYADLMRARPQSAETQREAAGYIFRETRRLEELSRKLLALMGLERRADGEESAIRLCPVTDRALFARLARSLPDTEGAALEFAPCGCTVRGDAALLDDLLRNLIRNALHACEGRQNGRVTVSCQAQDGLAAFTVADNGCGIPAADLPRVTEPFYMVDKSRARAGGGSGIGLTLCARIAALHHSRLELQSREGCGTTVTFRLPLADPPEEADHAD